jgi:hypothetical protein
MKEEFRTEAHPDLTQAAPHYLSQFSPLQKKLLTHQDESSLPGKSSDPRPARSPGT